MAHIEDRETILKRADKILSLTDEIKYCHNNLRNTLDWFSDLDSLFDYDELWAICEKSKNINKILFEKLENLVVLIKRYCEPVGQQDE